MRSETHLNPRARTPHEAEVPVVMNYDQAVQNGLIRMWKRFLPGMKKALMLKRNAVVKKKWFSPIRIRTVVCVSDVCQWCVSVVCDGLYSKRVCFYVFMFLCHVLLCVFVSCCTCVSRFHLFILVPNVLIFTSNWYQYIAAISCLFLQTPCLCFLFFVVFF